MGLGSIHNNFNSVVLHKKISDIRRGFLQTVLTSALFVTIFILISVNQAYALNAKTVISFDDVNVNDPQHPVPFYFIGHGTSISVNAVNDPSICTSPPPPTIPVTLTASDSLGSPVGTPITLNFIQDDPSSCIYHLPGYVQLSTGQSSNLIPRLQVVNNGYFEVKVQGTDGWVKADTINTDPWGSYGSNPNQPNKTVKIHCTNGNSPDAICSNWKTPAGLDVPYTVSGTTYHYTWACTTDSLTSWLQALTKYPGKDFPCPDPSHYDVYVEIDWMEGQGPNPTAIQHVINAFKNAPIPDSDGTRGITLHVLLDQNIGFHKYKITGPNEGDDSLYSDYNLIKRANFGTSAERAGANVDKILTAKRQVFHYALFAVNQSGTSLGSSGKSEMPSPPSTGAGNDILISLGAFSGGVGSIDEQEGTFMHELGHNLDLNHGGPAGLTDATTNCKPNYLSVMSYSQQFSDLLPGRPLNYSGESVTNGGVDVTESNPIQQVILTHNPQQWTVYGGSDGRPSQPMSASDMSTFPSGVALNNISTNKFSCNYGPPNNTILSSNDDWHNLKFNFTAGSSDFADGAGAPGVSDDFAGGAGPNFVAFGELNDYHPENQGMSLLFWIIIIIAIIISIIVGIIIFLMIKRSKK
ncbi:MAG: hypothetical protein HY222_03860 [Thaumarchaeota archaeon]|nr:hypothetical protein [Nitrososphaerota archaeon]MBI3641510.1 hypothetical protein [Nitrososphaerota archaeon]